MKKILSAVALLSVLALGLAGCGSSSSSSSGTGPIKIGFVNHLTGDIAAYGTSMKNGTEVAVEYINKNGGINGRNLEVVYVDDQSKLDQVVAGTRKLVDQDKVPIVIGSAASSFTLAMVPLTQEAKVVHLNSISTNPKLADAGKYFFALMPGDSNQGDAWMDVAKKMGVKEAAVVYINNDYGNGVKDVFTKAFTTGGGKVLATIGFNESATSFQSEMQKLKDSGAKYTFIVSHVKEGSLLLKQAKDLGVNTTWIADTAMQTDDVIKQAGTAAEGVYALSVGQKDHPKYQDFLKAYSDKFHDKPTIWADFAWDTVMVAAEGLKKGGTDPAKIRDAIAGIKDMQGATGVINFDAHGIRSAVNSFTLYKVQGGQWVVQK